MSADDLDDAVTLFSASGPVAIPMSVRTVKDETSPEAIHAFWERHAQAVADATGHPCIVTAPGGTIRAEPRTLQP